MLNYSINRDHAKRSYYSINRNHANMQTLKNAFYKMTKKCKEMFMCANSSFYMSIES